MVSSFLTNAEVVVDPARPIESWGLSADGRARAAGAAAVAWHPGVGRIVSSTEQKAIDTAAIVADTVGLVPSTDAALGEIDRSATGYLPLEEFEGVVDAFFATPDDSVRGWERAVDAQARIVGGPGADRRRRRHDRLARRGRGAAARRPAGRADLPRAGPAGHGQRVRVRPAVVAGDERLGTRSGALTESRGRRCRVCACMFRHRTGRSRGGTSIDARASDARASSDTARVERRVRCRTSRVVRTARTARSAGRRITPAAAPPPPPPRRAGSPPAAAGTSRAPCTRTAGSSPG